jgi:hypothetical protein
MLLPGSSYGAGNNEENELLQGFFLKIININLKSASLKQTRDKNSVGVPQQ